MKYPLILYAVLFLIPSFVFAQQQPPGQTITPYGQIDTADLKMTSCDFEKDANAMVLFDRAVVTYDDYTNIVMERHKRIKIFNDKGKDEANIRIDFYGAHRNEIISDVIAETINLDDKTIEYTRVDEKLIYTEVTDKNKKAIIFTFPKVRAGSVIEFKYRWKTPYGYNYPDWVFQSDIPARYSEFDASFHQRFLFQWDKKVYQHFVKDTSIKKKDAYNVTILEHIWALANIKAYEAEPYMDYPGEYLQRILFKGFQLCSWDYIGSNMLEDEDFGRQLDKSFMKADTVIAKAQSLKTKNEKIAYLFNFVKTNIKWNKTDEWFTVDGVKKAWDKKTGNSTEINLILYHLLKAANIKTSLLAIPARDKGKIDTTYPSTYYFNKTVVYCPADYNQYFVLDASNPYNTYNTIPEDIIESKALLINPGTNISKLFKIKNGLVRETIFINGSIGPTGILEGKTQISGPSYSREKYLRQYNELGEKKYIEKIQDKNRSLKISGLTLDNIEKDTLPLVQSFDFTYNLTEPDGDYMYFNPNLFTGFNENPFLSETRVSDINLGALYNYSINGLYKIPNGYKVDVLPKLVALSMDDKSIVFKRLVGETDGVISIHYTINYKRSIFSKLEYPGIHDFYKKMVEMLNEPVVLKKL